MICLNIGPDTESKVSSFHTLATHDSMWTGLRIRPSAHAIDDDHSGLAEQQSIVRSIDQSQALTQTVDDGMAVFTRVALERVA